MADVPKDELIKPLGGEPPKNPNERPGNETESDAANNAWLEAMNIPPGFSGLSLSPKSVAAVTVSSVPSDPASPVEPQVPVPVILGATWKSNLGVSDKPSVHFLRECPADQTGNCEPQQIPDGGPVVSDYFYEGAPQTADQVPPPTNKTFEIGCVVVGTQKDALGKDVPQTECALHIHPGAFPGKYQVVLTANDAKLVGSFEVVGAAPPPAADPALMTRSAPQSKPAAGPKPAVPK